MIPSQLKVSSPSYGWSLVQTNESPNGNIRLFSPSIPELLLFGLYCYYNLTLSEEGALTTLNGIATMTDLRSSIWGAHLLGTSLFGHCVECWGHKSVDYCTWPWGAPHLVEKVEMKGDRSWEGSQEGRWPTGRDDCKCGMWTSIGLCLFPSPSVEWCLYRFSRASLGWLTY